MPRVSVLTATHAAGAAYLSATGASIAAQDLPAGWDVEWVVQEDGVTPQLESVASAAGGAMTQYDANGAQLGPGGTRNLALSRVTGDLVQVLDHDDLLLPGALSLLIQKFLHHPIHWAVAAADDLLDDGSRKSWESALPFGLLQPGVVNEWAERHGGNWPVHCAGLMMRTEAVRALGGWSTTPVDEDIILLAALSELGTGWNEQTVTWLYRQHAGQTTRTTAWRHLAAAGRRIALQRARAVRNVGLRVGRESLDFGASSSDVQVGPGLKQPADLAG